MQPAPISSGTDSSSEPEVHDPNFRPRQLPAHMVFDVATLRFPPNTVEENNSDVQYRIRRQQRGKDFYLINIF